MGFDVKCGLSGVSLMAQEVQLILLRKSGETFVPVAPPVSGFYDRVGGAGAPEGPFEEALEAALAEEVRSQRIAAKPDEEIFSQVALGGVTFEGDPLATALIQTDVVRGLVETVTSENPAASAAALAAKTTAELVQSAFSGMEPGPALAFALLSRGELEDELRDRLIRLIQMQTWMEAQGVRWEPSVNSGRHTAVDIAESFAAAEMRFAGSPSILRALARGRSRVGHLLDRRGTARRGVLPG